LVRHILSRLAEGSREAAPTVTDAALKRLCAYSWPGNVRELENQLARAHALAGPIIDVADLSPHVAEPRGASAARTPPALGSVSEFRTADADDDDLAIRPRVERLERQLIEAAMERTGGNQTAAAKLLGLSRYGLQKKLARMGLREQRG
jgi:DNA-binding NtrC family response regulator